MQSKKHHASVSHLRERLRIKQLLKSVFWFSVGAYLGLFLFVSFVFIYFQKTYSHVVYPGVTIGGVPMSGKTEKEVMEYYLKRNNQIANTEFTFTVQDQIATLSAKGLDVGYDEKLLAKQAYSVG